MRSRQTSKRFVWWSFLEAFSVPFSGGIFLDTGEFPCYTCVVLRRTLLRFLLTFSFPLTRSEISTSQIPAGKTPALLAFCSSTPIRFRP